MKKLIIVLFFTIFLNEIKSQDFEITENKFQIENVDLPPIVYKTGPPKFAGDEYVFNDFISKNAKYPKRAFNEKIEGNVIVEVNISQTGSIEILKVIGYLGGGCEREAARIVNLMPCWQPAMQNGVAVKCKMLIPVRFEMK